MAKKIINIDSTRSKLKKIAKDSKRDFDAVLLQFFQERLLYRLSISALRENFVLKGGLLLLVQDMDRFRPTKDIDFLGIQIKNDLNSLRQQFEKIIIQPCKDQVVFLPESIEISKIKEDAEYEGVRIKIDSTLGNIKKKLSIDIGFNDVITPSAKNFNFPVLLDLPEPNLKCYSFESVISEKFQAIVWLNFQTSRMKDFFDIYYLSKNHVFQSKILKEALDQTFQHRNTMIENHKIIFDKSYKTDKDKTTQWNAFLRKNRLHAASFSETLEAIERFLSPLLEGHFESKNYFWNFETSAWLKAKASQTE